MNRRSSIFNGDGSLVPDDKISHLEVLGSHKTPALALNLHNDHGNTQPLVSRPVLGLTLLAAVGDGVAPDTSLAAWALTCDTSVIGSGNLGHPVLLLRDLNWQTFYNE